MQAQTYSAFHGLFSFGPPTGRKFVVQRAAVVQNYDVELYDKLVSNVYLELGLFSFPASEYYGILFQR